MVTQIRFNTGRYYSVDGQRITAFVQDRRCYFRDHDRGIDASFASNGNFASEFEMKQAVLWMYDHGPACGLRYESGWDVDARIAALPYALPPLESVALKG